LATQAKNAREFGIRHAPANLNQVRCCSSFYVERDHARWLCELRDHGEVYGVEAQFFRNEVFNSSRRFDRTINPRGIRASWRLPWAHEWRKSIEEDA
jgi:hypothetical protein